MVPEETRKNNRMHPPEERSIRMNPLAKVIFKLFAGFWTKDPPEEQLLLVLWGEDQARPW